jgi:protein-L-isoaspartate(D-aspartate) O-methyltransferase
MIRDLETKGIRDERVISSMRAVPRDSFVEEALQGKAYTDASLPIGEKQTISQPWIVARMSELLEPDGTGAVLEIGTGSGYQAAVFSPLFDRVFTVERIAALSSSARRQIRSLGLENVHFKIFDGSYGWSEFAPYRGIAVTAAAPEVPEPLLEQLAVGGHLVIPIGASTAPGEEQQLIRITRTAEGLVRESHGRCRFVPMIGKLGFKT